LIYLSAAAGRHKEHQRTAPYCPKQEHEENILQLPPQRRAAIGDLAQVLQLRLEVRRRGFVMDAHGWFVIISGFESNRG
jgi:hypothetical protein